MKEKTMRTLIARVGLGLVLLTPAVAGCNLFPLMNKDRVEPERKDPGRTPDAAALVEYLNNNASRVQAVQCTRVAIDCKQGRQAIGLDGMLVFEKPRNFRLRAMVVGQPTVDIGSNE